LPNRTDRAIYSRSYPNYSKPCVTPKTNTR
jgi:hypothetical protein